MNNTSETITEVNDGISLIQNKSGLNFGTDALMLAAFIRSEPNGDAVEIGAGSGIISFLLAKRGKLKHINAVEVQPYYAALVKRNAEVNGLCEKVTSICGDIRDYDGNSKTVFTNPPYMKCGNGKKNADNGKYIARHEVFGDIWQITAAAGRILLYGGRFYCVYRPDRLTELLSAMEAAQIEPKRIRFVHQDTKHKPCLVLVEGRKCGSAGCDVLRPLFICNDGESTPTADAQYIYDNGEMRE